MTSGPVTCVYRAYEGGELVATGRLILDDLPSVGEEVALNGRLQRSCFGREGGRICGVARQRGDLADRLRVRVLVAVDRRAETGATAEGIGASERCLGELGCVGHPFLKTPHTSPAYFADEFPPNESIEDYVLKPLYSFAGLGVDMEPTREKLAALPQPHSWILQKKVNYAAFVETVDGPKSKAELRMMFLWPENEPEPILVNNLVRMSQGKMMGVNFNKEKTWVGSSIALHPR